MQQQLDETGAPVTLDTSDVDRYLGQRVAFAEMWDPASATEIRRWVQALDYANPVHYDEEMARASRFGGIVAPQSFTVAMDYGHGCHPSCIGHVPGTHLIFGGEEWWFYGGRIRPGDFLRQERYFAGYKVRDTGFAGPTMFSDGDTYHYREDGALFAKERATSIRYLREEANRRGVYGKDNRSVKTWTEAEMAEIDRLRFDWMMSNRAGVSPNWHQVKVGDTLHRRVIGPHTPLTFGFEYRAHRQNIWGTWRWNPPEGLEDPAKLNAGFEEDMTYNFEAQQFDPRQKDGLYFGPSSGHLNPAKAEKIGMGGTYGYGASMNAWHLDSVAFWAGNNGYIWHSKTQFRKPAFEGDVTFIEGEVVDKAETGEFGMPCVTIKTRMTTQEGDTILTGSAQVALPHAR